MIELVLGHFAAQGVAVNAEDLGSTGLVAIGAVENASDKAFFKFTDGLTEEDATFDHL